MTTSAKTTTVSFRLTLTARTDVTQLAATIGRVLDAIETVIPIESVEVKSADASRAGAGDGPV